MQRKEVLGLLRLGFSIVLLAGISVLLLGRLDELLRSFMSPVMLVVIVLAAIGFALMSIGAWIDSGRRRGIDIDGTDEGGG